MIVMLKAAQRDELAIVEGGVLRSWYSFSAVEDASTAQCRLALSERFNQAVTLHVPVGAPTVLVDDLVIMSERKVKVAAVRRAGERWQVLAEGMDLLPGDGLHVVAAALGSYGRPVPVHVDQWRPEVLTPMSAVETVAECAVLGYVTMVGCSTEGLVRLRGIGDEISREIVQWEVADAWQQPESVDWKPPAQVIAAASGMGGRAAVVRHGQRIAVCTEALGVKQWYNVSSGDFNGAGAALEHAWGLDSPLAGIAKWTAPSQITYPHIRDARLLDRRVTPAITPSPLGSKLAIEQCCAEWVPEREIQVPTFGRMPAAAKAAFGLAFQSAQPAYIAVGASVTERWSTDAGMEVSVSYELEPGQLKGQYHDFATGARISVASIDDEGHVAQGVGQCPYCQARGCSKCANAVGSCPCCGIELCSQCAASDSLGLCPACRAMRRPGKVKLALSGRWKQRDEIAEGDDRVHSVVLEYRDWTWIATAKSRTGEVSTHRVVERTAKEVFGRAR